MDLLLEGPQHVPKVSTTLTPSQLDTLCKHIKMNSDKDKIKSAKASNPVEGHLTKSLKSYISLLENCLNLDLDEV